MRPLTPEKSGTEPLSPSPKFLRRGLFALAGALAGLAALRAAEAPALRMEILVNGVPRPEFAARGARYIEALPHAEYTIRLTNTTGGRIAVALAVDGLNSIDARHTGAREARKWVLDPWESAEISGWQVERDRARAFFFTTEARSYGAWLGDTRNLGNIEAVVFRERRPPPPPVYDPPVTPEAEAPYGWRGDSSRDKSSAGGRGAPAQAPVAPAPPASASAPASRPRGDVQSGGGLHGGYNEPKPSDDYAATGIGRDQYHPVDTIDLELESRPYSLLRLRYEFRPELVRLGVLPPPFYPRPDPMERRERGGGFGWAPEPRGS